MTGESKNGTSFLSLRGVPTISDGRDDEAISGIIRFLHESISKLAPRNGNEDNGVIWGPSWINGECCSSLSIARS
jgi:hypothetical protein